MPSNDSVNRVIEILDKKILELRKIYPKHELRARLMKFGKNDVANWMEYTINNTEENYDYNEKILNEILDWINRIDKILKNNQKIPENTIKRSTLKLLIKEIILEERNLNHNSSVNRISNNQIGSSSQCSGYSHDVTIPDITAMVRDPLNDPKLTGKMNEVDEYKFDEPTWSPDSLIGKKFGNPIAVYYNTILLGDIILKSNVYEICGVTLPSGGMMPVKKSRKNKFKTKNDAARIMHVLWKRARFNGGENNIVLKEISEGEYRFADFDWLSNMAGFNKPTDVYYGSIYLGTIVSKPNGYVIELIDTPQGQRTVEYKNRKGQKIDPLVFKTKDIAAKVLHTYWKKQRST